MKKLLLILIVVGMLISAEGCNKKKVEVEPDTYNDTPTYIVAEKHGIWWKIGYVPTKAVHELCSGVIHGICGVEPIEKGGND